MSELHPSPTAKSGHLPSDGVVTKGINADVGAFPATKDVYCKQCGFPCNLVRDARKINEFSSETQGRGVLITDHGYLTRSESESDIYDGTGRTTSTLTSEISNGSFEDWTAGSPDSWTVAGTTVSQETTSGYFEYSDDGVSSAKLVRSGSDISISQSPSTPSDFNSNFVIFRARVKCLTNDVIRLCLDINGQSYYSSYNITQQRFQEVSASAQCPATVTSLTVYILADNSDGTAYIDLVKLTRSGNPATASVDGGCPFCGSYNYH